MLTQLSRHSVGTCKGNELTHNQSWNARSKLSKVAQLMWAKSGLKSGTSACELISKNPGF